MTSELYEKTKNRRKYLLSMGRCVVCGKSNDTDKHKCSTCLLKERKYHKQYRVDNKNKIQDSQKRSMAKKPELYKAIKHKTYENHKEDWYRWTRERRARLLSADGSYTKQEWKDLLGFYGGKCLSCGSTDRVEADHVIPLSRGGSNYIDNIQPLCRICNASKSDKIIDFRLEIFAGDNSKH